MTTVNKIYLKDYTPPVYDVDSVDLDIRVFDEQTLVDSTLVMTKKHEGALSLLGRKLHLQSISLDGKALGADEYVLDDESLTILANVAVGQTVSVSSQVVIYPQDNSELEGLYLSGAGDDAMYVTQCEAQGFRKITFYPDRPDVLSVFTTRLEASKKYPTLLANGNLVQTGDVGDDRHFAIWHDPTKKPSYLFACVVANLAVLTDSFTTSEGRDVLLEIYAVPHDIDKCHVAMQALKDSMKWDEDNYGRAYDLDRYMIVATSQFNMGAMENKGLNIFNTSCVLSSPETTSDLRNFRVKSVIAHEYFHNWTGNRITCRDWFQLCLKEGLTVFRDQSFSGDFQSKAVQRIEDVGVLRAAQFSEDAGALAHPVRPESFVEINNFYTATVYEKGAEIVRMMANLLGADKYRAGMDEYFRRHDGQAVTVEDFVAALATQDERINLFMQWYRQPATPVLSGHYDYDDKGVRVHLSQSIRHVSGYDKPKDLPIPVEVAVFDDATGQLLASDMLLLTQSSQSFEIALDLVDKKPLVSVLRGFSAPVLLNFEYSDEELSKLALFETDGFNRWQALGMLVHRYLIDEVDNADLIAKTLAKTTDDLMGDEPMLAARLFDMPSENELASGIEQDYTPTNIKLRRDKLKKTIAHALKDKLMTWYDSLPMTAYQDTPKAMGVRSLRNVVLDLLAWVDKDAANTKAVAQYQQAGCMSERLGALSVMVHHDLADKDAYLVDFYERFKDEALVIDSWFMVQSSASHADVAVIDGLMARDDFDWHTPNRVRSVLSAVAQRPVLLWSQEGLGLYLSALVKLDGLNPQLSARLLGVLAHWHTLNDEQKSYVKDKLTSFAQTVKSKNVLELCQQLLASDENVGDKD